MNWNDIKALLTEERAVSPVIGVILMVAVTVILAAVVGMFVLGLGSSTETTPQASFEFDYDSTAAAGTPNLEITHNGGNALNHGNVIVVEDGAADTPAWNDPNGNGNLDAGEYGEIEAAAGSTVKVIWEGENGDSAPLATYDVPA